MILLNELRIGNFIKGPLTPNGVFYPEFSPVKPIELQLRLEHFVWFKANPDLYKQIDPIPLSEEWMQKFSTAKGHDLKWDLHQYIMVLKRYERFFLYYGNKGYMFEVKFVHQLQNVCFALTREELVLLKEWADNNRNPIPNLTKASQP
ncbi:MAG: hypothetical protein JST58_06865 [Bacteroidetes bacterium]|nr:hypothetical protein [Bacteroidota bacterium]